MAIMNAVTYSNFRKNPANVMGKICEDHNPVIITRKNLKPVVMISLEESFP